MGCAYFVPIRSNVNSVRLPKGMNALFPTKILLRTGPAFKDRGCTENVDVEVDLVPPGECLMCNMARKYY